MKDKIESIEEMYIFLKTGNHIMEKIYTKSKELYQNKEISKEDFKEIEKAYKDWKNA